MPASSASSATRSAVSEVSSAGLTTRVQPAASAGPIFQASISRGKFHGSTQADDADGLADDEGDVVVGGGRHLVVDLVDGLAVPAQALDRLGQVDGLAVEDGLAAVEALHHREVDEVVVDQPGEALDRSLALGGMGLRPAVEGGAGCGDRGIDVLGAAGGQGGEHGAGRRIDGLEGPARAGGDLCAADHAG